jgi:hypothetical protein
MRAENPGAVVRDISELTRCGVAVTGTAGAARQLMTAPEGIRVVVPEDTGTVSHHLGEQFHGLPALPRLFGPPGQIVPAIESLRMILPKDADKGIEQAQRLDGISVLGRPERVLMSSRLRIGVINTHNPYPGLGNVMQ